MVPSLVRLCAREVVGDHGSSPVWLSCVPRELYRPLLEAALEHCRPLAVGELVQRWPERTLTVGGRKKPGHCPPNRLCVQALLLAVVRGLTDRRCRLQVLDLCDLQTVNGRVEDSMGGWSLTVALCSTLLQAQAATSRGQRRDGERERKRGREVERERDDTVKRDRGVERENRDAEGGVQTEYGGDGGAQACAERVEVTVRGVRRRMELLRRSEALRQSPDVSGRSGGPACGAERDAVLVRVRTDLFVNSRSWERVRGALGLPGPLRLHCRYLRVEELPATSIRTLLGLLPPPGLLGLDVRYSSLGVAGLGLLLPHLAPFPHLHTLRLHYCNLDLHRAHAGQQEALQDMSRGLGLLTRLSRLSLTALRMPGHLRLLLSSLSQPLEVLEMPYLSLTPADLAYLSSSQHASSLRELDLSENRLVESSLPSLRRLLSQAKERLTQLSLCGCGLSDALLGALLPSLSCCRALRTLRVALNPLSREGVLMLARAAAGMASLQLLLYPSPLEEYTPGLPPTPCSSHLLDWPLTEDYRVRELTLLQIQEVLTLKGRAHDLLMTSDLLKYSTDLAVDD